MANVHKIDDCLALYDLYVVEELKKKHTAVAGAKWLFAPADEIGFRLAKQVYKEQKMFPIYFVYRNAPAVIASGVSSFSAFTQNIYMEDNEGGMNNTKAIMVYLKYQVDFYSNYMFDMNKFNTDYFKFHRAKTISFDFSEVGLKYQNQQEVLFEDIEENNNLDEEFQTGRYFHYIYRFNLLVPLFDDIHVELPLDKFVISLYNETDMVYQNTTKVTA